MWHLDNFSNEKLIDIVKNYKLYKYKIEVKFEAQAILKDRGISEDEINGIENIKAVAPKQDLLLGFKNYSIVTICLYIILIVFQYFVASMPMLIAFALLFVGFFIFLLLCFRSQKQFYLLIKQLDKSAHGFMFFILGILVYPIYYFYLINRMKKHTLKYKFEGIKG